LIASREIPCFAYTYASFVNFNRYVTDNIGKVKLRYIDSPERILGIQYNLLLVETRAKEKIQYKALVSIADIHKINIVEFDYDLLNR